MMHYVDRTVCATLHVDAGTRLRNIAWILTLAFVNARNRRHLQVASVKNVH